VAAYVLFFEPLPPPVIPLPASGSASTAAGSEPAARPALPPPAATGASAPLASAPPAQQAGGQGEQPRIGAVARLRQLVAQPTLPPPQITLNRSDGIYRTDRHDVVKARVTLPPGVGGFVYVDDFQEDGQVYHLLPEPLAPSNRVPPGGSIQVGHDAANAGQHDRVWEVGPPFGRARIVVLVSSSPLYNGLRPIGEKSEDYLAILANALVEARSTGLAMTDVAIETRSGP
jgi:hypothetical protein